jgi:glycine oxidase
LESGDHERSGAVETGPPPTGPFDVVVVGGGIIGLAIAREAAVACATVALVDRDLERGADATQVAAGMLAPVGEHEFGERDLLPMNLASAALYPDLIGQLESATGLSTGYRRDGGIHVALDGDEAAVLERMVSLQEESGLEPRRLTPSQAREEEPGLSSAVRSGVLAPGDGSVDPRLLASALEADAVSRGAVVLREVPVTGLVRQAGRVVGVETAGGPIAAGTVVLATGAEAGRLPWLEPVESPPVRPVKGQVVELRAGEGPPPCLRAVVTERVYVVPRPDGRIVVGATVEEQGWDREVTFGGVFEMLREAYRVLPDLAESSFTGARAGFRPGTPDNLPIVGPAPTPGLVLATGHYRNGVLLAPLTGVAVARMIADGLDRAPGMEAADPARFRVTAGNT